MKSKIKYDSFNHLHLAGVSISNSAAEIQKSWKVKKWISISRVILSIIILSLLVSISNKTNATPCKDAIKEIESDRIRLEFSKIVKHESDYNPWTIYDNKNKKSYTFKTKEQAVNKAVKMIKIGNKNFDVGCSQINYKWHAKHFNGSLNQMLDPVKNIRYGAEYYRRIEDSSVANRVANYHSSTRSAQNAYKKRYAVNNAILSENQSLKLNGESIDAAINNWFGDNESKSTYLVPLVQKAAYTRNTVGDIITDSKEKRRNTTWAEDAQKTSASIMSKVETFIAWTSCVLFFVFLLVAFKRQASTFLRRWFALLRYSFIESMRSAALILITFMPVLFGAMPSYAVYRLFSGGYDFNGSVILFFIFMVGFFVGVIVLLATVSSNSREQYN